MKPTNMQGAVYAHSSEAMGEISDNSVALTVTSPPYWNAIDYDIHANNNKEFYRTRAYANGYTEYEEYLDWLQRIFEEVRRVTKPGGLCAIIIGTVLLDGKHYPVPLDLTSRLTRKGWDFHQDIIWHKCTAGVKRAGVAIQKPFPGYYYPNIMTEYILVLRKPGEPIYKNRTSVEKDEAKYPINRLFTMDTANNIWHIAPVPPNVIDHPCPFPEEIVHRLVKLYSYPGEVVLDPFCGAGTTLKVAAQTGRAYVGYDVIEKYVEMSRNRVTEPLSLRPKQLVAVFDKIAIDEPSGSLADQGTSAQRTRRRPRKEQPREERLEELSLRLFEP